MPSESGKHRLACQGNSKCDSPDRNTLGLYFAVEPRSLFDRLSENYAFIYLISEDLGEAPRRVASRLSTR